MIINMLTYYKHSRYYSSCILDESSDDINKLHSTLDTCLWTPEQDDINPFIVFNWYIERELSSIEMDLDYTLLESITMYSSLDGINWTEERSINPDYSISFDTTIRNPYVKFEFTGATDFYISGLTMYSDYTITIPENFIEHAIYDMYSEEEFSSKANIVQFNTDIFCAMEGVDFTSGKRFDLDYLSNITISTIDSNGYTDCTLNIPIPHNDYQYILLINDELTSVRSGVSPTTSPIAQVDGCRNYAHLIVRGDQFQMDFYSEFR